MATSFVCVEVGHWLRVRSWEEAHEKRNKRSECHLLLHSEKFTAISKGSFLISTFSSETWPYGESKTHSRARGHVEVLAGVTSTLGHLLWALGHTFGTRVSSALVGETLSKATMTSLWRNSFSF